MVVEFDFIFQVVGWQNFWSITKQGSRALTMEFLCTLNITDTGVVYRFFLGRSILLLGKDFSLLLGFDAQFVVDVDFATQDFDKGKF